MTVLAIIVGGGIGATLRYVLGLNLAPSTPPDFPWVTFVINLVGAFALGAVMTLLAAHRLPGPWGKPFLSTGVIGGFTTWSHFIVEADQLIGARRSGVGIAYLVLSIFGGVISAALGARLAELRLGRPTGRRA
ncbi:fluoride efflux transporter CrcB [Micromonospora peucetia]|uniref:fluoride efflux transporter CrcB n=1 Tax=Micromonospora peucetia TaxID=47871 RepID=UPI002257BE6B|nr:fluoride efflux transporter CrcB [Micromonospora peucetia]MCX4388005.1 fluoride efflux transporter CrcB [Micromonospora peucetia]